LGSHLKLPEQSFLHKCPALKLGLTEFESGEIGTTIKCAMKTVIANVCDVEIENGTKTVTRVASPKVVD